MKTQIRKSFMAIMLVFALCISLMPTKVLALPWYPNDDFRIRISDEGIVIWDDVAKDYEIQVSYVEYPSVEEIRLITKKTKDTNFDLKSALKKELAKTGEYSIVVYAFNTKGKFGGGDIYSFPVKYFFVSSLPILPEPQNLRWDGKKAVWEAVEGAEGYIIKLFDKKGLEQRKIETYDTAYNFEEEDTEEVKDGCWFAVCSYCRPFEDSSFAESTKYGNLGYNGEISGNGYAEWGIELSEEGVLSWNQIGNASNYKIYVYEFEYGRDSVLWEEVKPSVNKYRVELVHPTKRIIQRIIVQDTQYELGDKAEQVWRVAVYAEADGYRASNFVATPENVNIRQHTVSFDYNGHGSDTVTQKVRVGCNAVEPSRYREKGWKFVGWYEDKEFEKEFSFDAPIEKDTTLYAKWKSIEVYTVTFDTNGHGTAPEPQQVKEGAIPKQPEALTATGWKFLDWYLDKEGTEEFKFDKPIDDDIIRYAK